MDFLNSALLGLSADALHRVGIPHKGHLKQRRSNPKRGDGEPLPMTPGRSCPLSYRYPASSFAKQPALLRADTLYVVGGLYGNIDAWCAIEALFGSEPSPHKQLVLNGDFHWFDVEPALFAEVEAATCGHHRLRGNVETEISAPSSGAGCGCAYPDAVDDGTVERSNRILARLQATARQVQAAQAPARLAALPMFATAEVGGLRIGLVHGDAESLAGWGFDPARLDDPAHRAGAVERWFEQAEVDVFASSHTCAAGLRRWPAQRGGGGSERVVINNGAAGMPCFAGRQSGTVSRIATTPWTLRAPQEKAELAGGGAQRLYGTVLNGVHIDAIAVPYDAPVWHARFLAMWPEGSDAHRGYWARIQHGPRPSVPLGPEAVEGREAATVGGGHG
jgi:hypothetical protein